MSGILRARRPLLTRKAGGLSASANQFISRIPAPSAGRKTQYATLIDALVTAGVWAKLDALYVLAAADQATALVNLRQSAYGLSLVSTPTFTADSGFTGLAGKYLDTTFNPTTAVSPNYTQDSAHISLYNYTAGSNGHCMGNLNSGGTLLTPNVSGTTVYHNINQGFTDGFGTITNGGVGFYLATRTAAQSNHLYVNGTDVQTGSFSSVTPLNETTTILHAAGVDWAGKVGCASIGSFLNATEVTALWNALHTYLQAVAGIP